MSTSAIDRLNVALAGRYHIERKLGEGGMVTVYLTDDIKHERKVALKVLKPELAAVVGAERFLAEIKTTANLQHPNILALYDSGEAEGFLYYVMPYIQGETLRNRLEREKQLPVDEAVRIATEVAEALQVAHEEGVIHRDIKPANILLNKGRPLVADFGIALAVTTAGAGRLTETGLSMGTPFYMSPEQASADREPSAASDVYSLGCVLYEMLVGDPPHTASSAQAVLAKILTGDAPAPGDARASIPANVDAAIRKALEKLPADRFVAAQDFARALHDPGFVHGRGMTAVAVAPRSGWNRLSIATSGISALLAVALVWVVATRGSEPPPVLHSTITLPDGEVLAFADDAPSSAGRPSLAISHGGERLAYVAARDGVSRLFVLDLTDGSAAVELPGTEGAFNPFFSPDGESLGFFTRTELKRISVRGGGALTLGEATYAVGADWPDEGTIVFADSEGKRITRISAETGEADARLDINTALLWWPDMLPDGKTLLMTDLGGSAFPSIMAVSLATGERSVVIQRGSGARYVESGHLIYAGEGGIMAAPFDARTASVTGPAVLVLEGVRLEAYGRVPQLAVSGNGLVAFAPGGDIGLSTPVWVDRDGSVETIPLPAARYGALELSPDGARLAITVPGLRSDVRVYDFTPDSEPNPVTTLDYDIRQPLWSPDGQRLAFGADVEIEPGAEKISTVFVQEIGGADASRLLEQDPAETVVAQAWSSTGDIALAVQTLGMGTNIWILPSGAREPQLFLDRPGDQWAGDFSPDGRWLTYHSDESGTQEVWVTDYPGGTIRRMLSTHAGQGKEPIWSPLGDEIFYRSDRSLYAVPIQADSTLTVGTPVHLFSGPFATVGGPEFDVGPDAQRFLMLREPAQPPATRIQLISNWFEELKRLAPN